MIVQFDYSIYGFNILKDEVVDFFNKWIEKNQNSPKVQSNLTNKSK